MKVAKISKEQSQRLMLGVMILLMSGAAVWTLVLSPQMKKIETLRKQRADAQAKLDLTNKELRAAAEISEKTVELGQIYDSVLQDIPQGVPITWFPPRVERFYSRMGVQGASATGGTFSSSSAIGLQDFNEHAWTIVVPKANFIQFGTALAAFETKENLMQITSLDVASKADDPEFQQVTMTANLLLPKSLSQGGQ